MFTLRRGGKCSNVDTLLFGLFRDDEDEAKEATNTDDGTQEIDKTEDVTKEPKKTEDGGSKDDKNSKDQDYLESIMRAIDAIDGFTVIGAIDLAKKEDEEAKGAIDLAKKEEEEAKGQDAPEELAVNKSETDEADKGLNAENEDENGK